MHTGQERFVPNLGHGRLGLFIVSQGLAKPFLAGQNNPDDIVQAADGAKVVDTYAYTYTYTATDHDLLDIYVWPYTFIYQWFIHFVGARERYDASNDHIAGIVMAGTD